MAREEKESESQRPTTKDTEIQATASIPNSAATKSNFRHSSTALCRGQRSLRLLFCLKEALGFLFFYLISNSDKKLFLTIQTHINLTFLEVSWLLRQFYLPLTHITLTLWPVLIWPEIVKMSKYYRSNM